jgi:SAM-dependent methyltransferase
MDDAAQSANPSRDRQQHLLEHISEFTEWGGKTWAALCRRGFYSIGSLENKKVLEIGFRFGKMTSFCALLGAQVTALETDASVIPKAQAVINGHGVSSKVSLCHYDGNLSHCESLNGKQFDVIFSKSVLVLMGAALPKYLVELDSLLSPGGSCLFLENGYGGKVPALLRSIFRRGHASRVDYFTDDHVKMVASVFRIQEVKKSYFPPIFLIVGRKKLDQEAPRDQIDEAYTGGRLKNVASKRAATHTTQ